MDKWARSGLFPKLRRKVEVAMTTVNLKDFACSCGPKSERRMKARHDWVSNTFIKGWKSEPKFQATSYLHLLDSHYNAVVENIYLDQWGVFKVKSESTKMEGDDTVISMQFDRFEDGLALALRLLYKQYGLQRKFIDEKEDD